MTTTLLRGNGRPSGIENISCSRPQSGLHNRTHYFEHDGVLTDITPAASEPRVGQTQLTTGNTKI
ncbi:hypothetical protein JAO82_11460 [Pontibaca sp. S1109L]|uniref:Uncharacterized protein n=1 Tax=Pontibaca salina TaxID=2795731 RepID=A0A934LZ42_9RHOB|nr:hypothetical protein [Pontibaca salina]